MPIDRFLDAQAYGDEHGATYAAALSDMTTGSRCKRGHWIWYVLPQLPMPNTSSLSRKYAIDDLEEAKEYLRHPILAKRYLEIIDAIHTTVGQERFNLREIIGSDIDLLKLNSSLVLFLKAAKALEEEPQYAQLSIAIQSRCNNLLSCDPDKPGFREIIRSPLPLAGEGPGVRAICGTENKTEDFTKVINNLHAKLTKYSKASFIPSERQIQIAEAIDLCSTWNNQQSITEFYIQLLLISRQVMEFDIQRYQNSIFSMHIINSRFFNIISPAMSQLREKMAPEQLRDLEHDYQNDSRLSLPLQEPKHYGFFSGFKKVVHQFQECIPSPTKNNPPPPKGR